MDIEFTVFIGSKSGEIVEAKGHRDVGPTQALVELPHCEVCGTDEHYKHADQGLGHEGVAIIKEIGSLVKQISDLRDGDRVGMGTVLWVLQAVQAVSYRQATASVSPVGIGGLGHLAIQMAAKMGMEAVVFRGTEAKREEAFQLGASDFYATKGVTEFQGVESVDCLLITASVLPDLTLYLPILAPFAKIFPLTISMDNTQVPALPFVLYGYSLIGSGGAHPQSVKAMLRFCAKPDIKPVIEKFPMTRQGIIEAMKKLEEGKVRYRGGLVV
ncbi:NADP-dependent alcohol dehydrogenase [Cladophialophora carrionii]|uniref:NADP-dependent alcohol dehydrogenase n=1 Tax=Cladophialophora carrionii TaxID=86049 RepID=A0A1C1D169_9EURO|nr:NADP-dependent alcohol dehydrogenase [Cladophialophora carrionii]